ncbi:MAG: M28 family peptidase [Bryobacteraceae bacterium]
MRIFRQQIVAGVLVLQLVFGLFAPPLLAVVIGVDRYLEDVKFLSSDEMKGRGTGTKGLDRAAKYIAQQFESAGLQYLNGGSYFQPFPVSINARMGNGNGLRYSLDGVSAKLKLNEDFIPFNFTATGQAEGPVVFAGYGITAKEYGYDDYAGLDVKDKIVLVLRHEPQEYDADSLFEGRVYTEHSQLFSKAFNAKIHGARAILLVNDAASHSSNSMEKFISGVSPASPGIPFLQLKSEIVEKWFDASGRDFRAVQEDIDEDLQPQSFEFPGSLRVRMDTDVHSESRMVNNVVGFLPGESDEYVVIGAHYDHLGAGEQYSLAQDKMGTPHPGADDNASGTAGVIALARWFSAQPRMKRGIVFVAFAGEELGLLGSSFYANHSSLPIENAVAMINMDMIGRIRENKVLVGGLSTGSGFSELLERIKTKYPFTIDTVGHIYGSSDHTSFQTKLVPVLFFFSGLHEDYHKPSDTWDKINPAGASKLLEMIGEMAGELANSPARPHYIRGLHSRAPASSGAAAGGGRGAYVPF